MRPSNLMTVAAVVLLAGGMAFVRAEQPLVDAPSADKVEKSVDKVEKKVKDKKAKLPKAYAGLSSLTDEQKQQIATIHQDAVAAKKAIEQKEDADIVALLTPEQKAELAKADEEETAKKKMGKKNKETDESPTTMPAE